MSLQNATGINTIQNNTKMNLPQKLAKEIKSNWELYLLIIPGCLLVLLFRFAPLYGLQIAFRDYNIFKGIDASPWVGTKWFKQLFGSPAFFAILKNALKINLWRLTFVFPAAIILALLINELTNQKFKRIVQSVSYLPHFLSWVIITGFVQQVLSPSTGPIRHVFNLIGMEPFSLLLKPSLFYPVLVSAEVWKEVGWGTILYLAAMSGIDNELYEASTVDGASKLRQIWHITLPGISFVLVMNLIFFLSSMIDCSFEMIYLMRNDTIRDIAEVFSTYSFEQGIGRMRYSFVTALGIFESAISFTLVVTFNRIAKKVGQDGIF